MANIVDNRSLKGIAYSVLELISGFNITDDNPIPIPWLIDLAVKLNETIVIDYFNEKVSVSGMYSTIDGLEIKEVAASEIELSGMRFVSNQKLFYSDVPDLVDRIGWKNISYLGSVDFTEEFSRRSLSGFSNVKTQRWRFPLYTHVGNKIYYKFLPTNQSMAVKMVALLKDQRNEIGFNESTTIFKTPSPFKLEMLMVKHIASAYGVPVDALNDAQNQLARIHGQSRQQSDAGSK